MPTPAKVVAGLALVIGSVVWIGWMMTQPTLTYDARYGNVVKARCESIYGPGTGGVRAPAVGVLEGTLYIGNELDEGSATILRPDGVDSPEGGTDPEADDVVEISAAQLSADCAAARVQRLQLVWLPTLGVGLGLVVLWSVRPRERTAGAPAYLPAPSASRAPGPRP